MNTWRNFPSCIMQSRAAEWHPLHDRQLLPDVRPPAEPPSRPSGSPASGPSLAGTIAGPDKCFYCSPHSPVGRDCLLDPKIPNFPRCSVGFQAATHIQHDREPHGTHHMLSHCTTFAFVILFMVHTSKGYIMCSVNQLLCTSSVVYGAY